MTRPLLSWFLGVPALVGLMLSPTHGEAYRVTTTLTQTPVTGQLASGGTFHGRLTLHDVTVDAQGQLTATGLLTGTATPALGATTAVPPHPFTTLAAVRSCPCSLRLNTRGLPGDRHRSNKMPSIEPSWPLRGPLSLVTPSQPAVRTHVACADQLP